MTDKLKTAMILVAIFLQYSATAQSKPDSFSDSYNGYNYYFMGAMDSGGLKTVVGGDTTRAFAPYSAMVVLTILQTWDAYLIWCADSVQKRGWDKWETDTTSYKTDERGNKLYYLMKTIPNYYRDRRENHPTIYGYIEWLRQRLQKGAKP